MDAKSTAPFVGLRPFEEESSHLFFGRRNQMNELLERLQSTRLVAVVGSSGCGKSSLVRAGLVPALKAGFLVKSRAAWRVLVIKPGKAPIRHLAAAVLRDGSEGEEEPAAAEVAALDQEIRMAGAEAVLERLSGSAEKGDHNVLLVVDQFEEIFRFGLHDKNQELRDEAADFVSVLLALAEESALPVYVVLTMRADFIRDCDDIPDLPDALNRSLFLVPRLTREQFREAIEGPVRWSDGSIANRLLDRLLNDSSREFDELPVLQHALLRTWKEWSEDGQGPMDAEHYEHAGTVERALDLDAEAALEGLDEAGLDRVRRLFQALTAIDDANRKIRRPARLSELEEITGIPCAEILPLLERFRADSRSLLVWSDSDPDPLIDISHESLIRNWKRLSAWADEEAESVALYRRLADAAADYPDRGGLWRDPKLQIGLNWRERAAPTRTWAERVAPEADFEGAMCFLDESIRAREEARARREREREEAHERERREATQRLRRTRRLLAAAAGFLVVMAAVALYTFEKKTKAENLERYYTLVFLAHDDLQTYPPRSLLLASAALGLPADDIPDLSSEYDVEDAGLGRISRANEVFLRALESSGGRVVASGAGSLSTLVVTPDGRRLVTAGGEGELVCWGLATDGAQGEPGEPIRSWLPELGPERITAIVGAGERLAAVTEDERGQGRSIRLLDPGPDGCPAAANSIVAELGAPVASLTASSSGRWLAAVAARDLRLWELSARSGAEEVSPPTAPCPSAKATLTTLGGGASGPWLAVGCSDGAVEVRHLGEGGLAGSLLEEPLTGAPIETVAASPGSGRLLVARVNGEASLFDLSRLPAEAATATTLPGNELVVAAAMDRRGERLVVWRSAGSIELWDLSGSEPRKLSDLPPAGPGGIHGAAFGAAPDGEWLLTAHVLPDDDAHVLPDDDAHVLPDDDKRSWEIRRWPLAAFDPAEETLVHELPPGTLETRISRVALSPDRTRAIVLDRSGGLGLWNLDPESPPEPVQGRRGVRAAAFAGDGRLLVAPWAGGVEVSPPDAGGSEGKGGLGRWAAELATARLAELAVSRDGRRVMGAEEDGRLHVWDLETGEEIFAPESKLDPPVVAAAFTPDGRRLVTAGRREAIRVHDLDGEEPGPVVEGSRDVENILTLDVSPDGRRLVTGGGGGVVRFWDLEGLLDDGGEIEPDEALTIPTGRDPVVAVAFTPDGEDVLVTTESGATRRWPVLLEDRYRLARELVGDGPVPAEIRNSLQADTSQEIFDALLLDPEERPQEPPGDTVALAAEEGDPAGLLRPR